MSEMLDIFDADLNYLGNEERSEIHKRGLWHQTFHCWIIKPNGKLLLQLRSKNKETNPGLLDISSAGHISAGEKPIEGIRELEEELGLVADPKKLKYIGYFKWATDRGGTKIFPYHNRELCHTYFLKDDTPLNKYKLQPEELDGVFELDLNDGRKLFSDEVDTIKISGYVRKDDNSLEKNERSVTKEDFTKYDNFWLRILNLVEDFNNNRKYIVI